MYTVYTKVKNFLAGIHVNTKVQTVEGSVLDWDQESLYSVLNIEEDRAEETNSQIISDQKREKIFDFLDKGEY